MSLNRGWRNVFFVCQRPLQRFQQIKFFKSLQVGLSEGEVARINRTRVFFRIGTTGEGVFDEAVTCCLPKTWIGQTPNKWQILDYDFLSDLIVKTDDQKDKIEFLVLGADPLKYDSATFLSKKLLRDLIFKNSKV